MPGDGKATSPNASPKTTTRPNAAVAVVRATSRERDAGGGPAASATTSKKRPRNDASVREKAIRAVVAASESCLRLERGDRALRVVGVSARPRLRAGELRAVGSEQRGRRRGGTRRGGARRVFARAASAVAAAAARAHPKVAAAPETHAAASAATAGVRRYFRHPHPSPRFRAYALAVACVHGVSVLVFAQTSLCAAAARSAMRCHGAGYAEMEDAAEEGDVLGPFARAPPQRPGDIPAADGERRDDGGGDEGLLFGLNGALRWWCS